MVASRVHHTTNFPSLPSQVPGFTPGWGEAMWMKHLAQGCNSVNRAASNAEPTSRKRMQVVRSNHSATNLDLIICLFVPSLRHENRLNYCLFALLFGFLIDLLDHLWFALNIVLIVPWLSLVPIVLCFGTNLHAYILVLLLAPSSSSNCMPISAHFEVISWLVEDKILLVLLFRFTDALFRHWILLCDEFQAYWSL